ncbi:uncharacterized protein LOC127290344 [Leptopilina boulardi]|uniref:uncharacterized protein LOC127290344 n=1 Tax=Leptopilina boulardi TaxID=63433 RepID=UPI0021F57342|nr:uncharacterized protein LOC127290344 [Leptopilina boulardi]
MDQTIPPEISKMAEEALADILPEKSKKNYEFVYANFVEWKDSNNVKKTSETVLMSYFKMLSQKYKPPTLWSHYSMLKSMIHVKEKISLEKYLELSAFLKKMSRGYIPKKSKVFSAEEVQKFLETAPDDHHLDTKVIMIFRVFGALRSDELVKVRVVDVKRQGEIFHVNVPVTKTMIPRSFVISDEFCRYVEKYSNLRPKTVSNDRFFLNFQNGKCTVQVIGKNKFASTPQKIAEFLKLPDSKKYTGHSFRRTSSTLLVDAGPDLTVLKRHGGWKSSAVAEGYIEESMLNNQDVSSMYSKIITLPSSSKCSSSDDSLKHRTTNLINNETPKRPKTDTVNDSPNLELLLNKLSTDRNLNFQNCTITINFQ